MSTETNVTAAATQTYRAATEIEEEEESIVFERNDGVMGIGRMKEEEEIEEMSSSFCFDKSEIEIEIEMNRRKEDSNSVYVAVGKSESSMDALCWTLTHLVNNSSSTTIYLIHVFPQIRYIPSPLGMLPMSQVSPTQLERYMSQERGKRTQLLQKFLDICSASKVKVDTMLIESDMIAKAILDLIPILNITKLVVGTNSNPRYRKLIKSSNSRSRGVGIADQIIQNAPITCEVKVVCQGKEVMINTMSGSPSPSPSHLRLRGNQHNFKALQLQAADNHDNPNNDSFSCMCFRPKMF